ncbi:MAG: PqqD family protein [Halobacteriota archaeon]|nr:PqqD family protein [Halobacteriota archaeon]
MMVSLESYPLRSEELVWRVIEDEIVILTSDGREIHTLNKVGGSIWEMADGTMSLDDIASKICDLFDVSLETAREDVIEFAKELSDKNILNIKDSR